MNNWEVIGTLSEVEMDTLRKLECCKRACKKLVQEVVKDWEGADIALEEFWVQVKKTRGLERSEDEFQINHITGELKQRPKVEGEWARIQNILNSSEDIRKMVRDMLAGDAK